MPLTGSFIAALAIVFIKALSHAIAAVFALNERFYGIPSYWTQPLKINFDLESRKASFLPRFRQIDGKKRLTRASHAPQQRLKFGSIGRGMSGWPIIRGV
jgi:hypothetical protein